MKMRARAGLLAGAGLMVLAVPFALAAGNPVSLLPPGSEEPAPTPSPAPAPTPAALASDGAAPRSAALLPIVLGAALAWL